MARIGDIAVGLPQAILTNTDIARRFPDWTAEKIEKKLGIVSRHVLSETETPVDMAALAANNLFTKDSAARDRIDYLIFCTQSPDFALPTSACILQDRLGLRKNIGAIDINQGCSGYVYALGVAKGLLSAGLASCVLLLTADGYTKLLREDDASVRTIFGDAATATLIEDDTASNLGLGTFVFGTDGSGSGQLIVENSGMRRSPASNNTCLYMNGPEVLNFTLREVPFMFDLLLRRGGFEIDDLDFVILHQANKFILEQLKRKLKLPDEKFIFDFSDVGNTVSSTIPIVIARASADGRIRRGGLGALLGFGVGLSWAACLLRY